MGGILGYGQLPSIAATLMQSENDGLSHVFNTTDALRGVLGESEIYPVRLNHDIEVEQSALSSAGFVSDMAVQGLSLSIAQTAMSSDFLAFKE